MNAASVTDLKTRLSHYLQWVKTYSVRWPASSFMRPVQWATG